MSKEASALRSNLRQLALNYAKAKGLPFYQSLGTTDPAILFTPIGDRHGNFLDASYRAIQHNPANRERLSRRHNQSHALPVQFQKDARLLDSSNSSDALLMNIFCYPEIGDSSMRDFLGLDQWTSPAFGVQFCVAGESKGQKCTEIDMTFSTELAVEAKLSEPEFQQAAVDRVTRYRNLVEVFRVDALPRCPKGFDSYQLLRNILAAHERGGRFLVLYDERRPDLFRRWEAVIGAIRIPALRERCFARTWQEIAAAVPPELRLFLVEKYGLG
jgi:hypothetical protein